MNLTKSMSQHPLVLFRDFRIFFLGRIISAMGDKFFTIALAWWVVSYGGENSKLHLGLLMAVNVLGVILFAPWMGALADRMDKKHCMMIADTARFIFLLLLTYFLYRGQLTLPLLYFCCFSIAAFVPLFESASTSSLLPLTDAERLTGAVAMDSSVLQLSNVLGAAIGGIVLASVGTLGAFLGNSLSFLISFCFIWAIKTNLKPLPSSQNQNQSGQIKEVLSYLFSNPAMVSLALIFCISNFFAAPLMLFIPMIVKFLLHYTVSWVAIMEGSLALGALITTLIISCFPKYSKGNLYYKLFLSGVIMGVMVLVVAWVRNGLLVSCAFFFLGVAMGSVNTGMQATFQQIVPSEMKGRFFSLASAACFSILPISFVINGLVSQYFSLPLIIAINGLALIINSTAFLFIPQVSIPDESIKEVI